MFICWDPMRALPKLLTSFLLLCGYCILADAAERSDRDRVVIKMRGKFHPTKETVTIGDIATVSKGDFIVRRKISSLDVAKLSSGEAKISKERVRLRMILAGIDDNAFHLLGAANTLLADEDGVAPTKPGSSPENIVLDFLREPVAERLGVPSSDVKLRLTRPLRKEHTAILDRSIELEHFLPPVVRNGSFPVKLGLRENGTLTQTVGVWIEAQVTRDVFVANREIERGQKLTEKDFDRERREVSSEQIGASPIGKVARRNIVAGTAVSEADLMPARAAKKVMVVRNRSTVEIRVRRRALTVKVSGAVAMQSGGVGDLIRVKNPSSGKVLTARVVDEGLVEIRL